VAASSKVNSSNHFSFNVMLCLTVNKQTPHLNERPFAYSIFTIDVVEQLRRLLQEAECRALNVEEFSKEAESLALKAEELVKEAESRALKAEELLTPQTLQQYLGGCHSLSDAIQVVTNPSQTTTGGTTNPTGRIYPRRIIPWDDFATRQEKVWKDISIGSQFSSQPAFPSKHQLEGIKSSLDSEDDLRYFERDTVEEPVQKLVDAAYNDLEQLIIITRIIIIITIIRIIITIMVVVDSPLPIGIHNG